MVPTLHSSQRAVSGRIRRRSGFDFAAFQAHGSARGAETSVIWIRLWRGARSRESPSFHTSPDER
jgi:hypothetical protein